MFSQVNFKQYIPPKNDSAALLLSDCSPSSCIFVYTPRLEPKAPSCKTILGRYSYTVGFLLMLICCTDSLAATTTKNSKTTTPETTSAAPSTVNLALPSTETTFHPAYVGVLLGYGNTNWSQMVSQDASSSTSTPTSAGGSGVADGITLGYALSPYFALEADFTHFPDADLVFSSYSVYRPLTETTSKTNAYALFGKFMLPLDQGKFSAFSEIGPGYVQRDDDLAQKGHFSGSFGVGVDYNINSRWTTELGLQYYTGYGDSTLKPAYDYIPFLYTVNLRIAYRFSL